MNKIHTLCKKNDILSIINKTTKMSRYIHRFLTEEEQGRFIDLYKDNISKNFLVSLFLRHHILLLIHPMIVVSLFYLTALTYNNILLYLLGFVMITLKFGIAHMWAHSLMLEYDLWSIKKMPKIFGQISSVIFYAFDHHHRQNNNDLWMANKLNHSQTTNTLVTLFTHWESFSLFTQTYPFKYSDKFLLSLILYHKPITIAYVLGHEVGVLFIPIAHDFCHFQYANKFGAKYLLKPLEYIGILANRQIHNIHHKHDHEYVYQSFFSSGIYCSWIDRLGDWIWNYLYHKYTNKCEVCLILKRIVDNCYMLVLLLPLLF